MRFVLQWHLTERCNLNCTHCYQNEEIIKEELTLKEKFGVVDNFVSFIKKLNEDSYSRGVINITGGEPFAYRDLEPLLAYISKFKRYLSFNFLSNGTMINEKNLELLLRYPPVFVQISIDGDKATHDKIRGVGAFDSAMKGIKRLKKAKIKVLISFTAHKENYKSFPKVAKIAREAGVDRVWSDRMIPEGVGIGMHDSLLSPAETFEYARIMKFEHIKNRVNPFTKTIVNTDRSLQFVPYLEKGHKCVAGKIMFALLPNGVVLPCRRLAIEIGNIRENSFEEIFYQNKFVQKLKIPNIKIAGCEGCNFQKSCNGGLRCLSYSITGDPFRKDPGCWR
jgi:radical SAM protein with 4Fe4S-binding SPASM domain